MARAAAFQLVGGITCSRAVAGIDYKMQLHITFRSQASGLATQRVDVQYIIVRADGGQFNNTLIAVKSLVRKVVNTHNAVTKTQSAGLLASAQV